MTSTGLRNIPDPASMVRIILTARLILEPLREAFGSLLPTSWYRSNAVNNAVGGASGSYHLAGSAVDLYSAVGISAEDLAAWLYEQTWMPLAEVIVEEHTGHLHIALDTNGILSPGKAKRKFLAYDGEDYRAWSP